jgi:plastocyanin
MNRVLLFVLVPIALALAPPAPAATHTVNQVNLTWQPDSVFIEVGDTVEWVWSVGSHTATNGTGAADPNAGTLFDAPLNSTTPLVSYTFNSVGDYPFFCRPHEGFGMKGNVNVSQPTPVQDSVESTTWSRVKAIYR